MSITQHYNSTSIINYPNIMEKGGVLWFEISGLNGVTKAEDGDDLYTANSIKCMPKEMLKPFKTLYSDARRVCYKYGIPHLKGFFILDKHMKSVNDEFVEIFKRYDVEKVKFCAEIEDAMRQRAEDFPEKKAIILAAIPTKADLSRKLRRHVSASKMVPYEMSASLDCTEGKVGSFISSVLDAISLDAHNTWKVKKGDSVIKATRKKWSAFLKRVLTKCDELGFISPKIERIAQMLREIDKQIPKEGVINGKDYLVIKGIVAILMDHELLLSEEDLSLAADIPSEIATASQFGSPLGEIVYDPSNAPASTGIPTDINANVAPAILEVATAATVSTSPSGNFNF
jgi:hypothetical protein